MTGFLNADIYKMSDNYLANLYTTRISISLQKSERDFPLSMHNFFYYLSIYIGYGFIMSRTFGLILFSIYLLYLLGCLAYFLYFTRKKYFYKNLETTMMLRLSNTLNDVVDGILQIRASQSQLYYKTKLMVYTESYLLLKMLIVGQKYMKNLGVLTLSALTLQIPIFIYIYTYYDF